MPIRNIRVLSTGPNSNGDIYTPESVSSFSESAVGVNVVDGVDYRTVIGKVVGSRLEGNNAMVDIELSDMSILRDGAWLGYCIQVDRITCAKCGAESNGDDNLCEHIREKRRGMSSSASPLDACEIVGKCRPECVILYDKSFDSASPGLGAIELDGDEKEV